MPKPKTLGPSPKPEPQRSKTPNPIAQTQNLNPKGQNPNSKIPNPKAQTPNARTFNLKPRWESNLHRSASRDPIARYCYWFEWPDGRIATSTPSVGRTNERTDGRTGARVVSETECTIHSDRELSPCDDATSQKLLQHCN